MPIIWCVTHIRRADDAPSPGVPGPARPYRRRGSVTAYRLMSPRDWTTSNGEFLHSDPGDWWVVGPDGSGRGVDVAEFPRLYEHLSADRYRRVGVVVARQATADEVVVSFEGPMTARAGMWIVTAPPGNSWAVPDAEFRSGYEPVDD